MQNFLQSSYVPSVKQALSNTHDNTHYKTLGLKKDQRYDIEFREVMKEKYIEQELKANTLRKEQLKDAEIRQAYRDSEARKKAAKEDTEPAKNTDIKDQNSLVAYNAAQNFYIEHGVFVADLPLQPSQLPYTAQEMLQSFELNSHDSIQDLTVDIEQFSGLDDLKSIQFLSILNSLQLNGSYRSTHALGGQKTPHTIEGFVHNLVQQYAQNDPSATLSNLTPQQVTQLRSHLAQQSAGKEMLNSILTLQNIDTDTALSRGESSGFDAGLDRQNTIGKTLNSSALKQVSGILSRMAQIVQPATTHPRFTQITFPPKDARAMNIAQDPQTSQQMAARLNTSNKTEQNVSQQNLMNSTPDLLGLDGEMETTDAEFNRSMKRFGTELNSKSYTPTDQTRTQTLKAQDAPTSPTPQAAQAPHISLLPGPLSSADGALSVADSILQELGLTGTLVHGHSSQSTGLSNFVTSAQPAGASHPAAQTVAAFLHKTASGGVNKAVTIRLDPPELGRVEIKMSFESHSKIKAVLKVENSETYLMMQRDHHILEKALREAGFDTKGALQFELAQDGHGFGQDGRHDTFHQGQNGDAIPEEDVDITQSTMTWYENTETGHMHYNLLV